MSSAVVNENLSGIFLASSLHDAQKKARKGVVVDSEREKFNLQMPIKLIEELDRLAETYGGVKKWMVLSAAMAHFLAAGRSEQTEWVEKVTLASLRKNYNSLLPKRGTPSDHHGGTPPKRG